MHSKCSFFVYTLVLLISGCGGGSGGTDTGGSGGGGTGGGGTGGGGSGTTTTTGVFLDSVVSGLGYRSATQEGRTNANGEFVYVDGETVNFFIGDIELPAVAGAGIITPRDVFATDDFEDRRVVNLARLLLSLDEDGDAGTGIAIADTAHSAATGLSIDLDVPTTEFEANTDVINLVAGGGGASGTLIAAEEAVDHLRLTSIEGTWQVFGSEDWITAVFLGDGRYMISETLPLEDNPPDGDEGLEYGTYEWNPLSSIVQVVVDTDTNGDFGLSAFQDIGKLVRAGSTLTAEDPADPVDSIVLERVDRESGSLAGGWMADFGVDGLVVLVFTATHYSWSEIGPATDAGFTGPEFGTYTWDNSSGDFNPVPLHDHNGDWAFSGESPGMTATLDGDSLTLAFPGSDGVTLIRTE